MCHQKTPEEKVVNPCPAQPKEIDRRNRAGAEARQPELRGNPVRGLLL